MMESVADLGGELCSVTALVNTLSIQLEDAIKQQMQQWKQREERWIQLEKKVEEISSQGSKVILDVGGKKFAASKSTLLNMQDSFFTVMLCSDRWKPNDDGAYFIDRNPKFFGRILEYLRTGTLRVNDLHFEQMAGLKEEFDFYQIAMPLLPLTFVSTYGFTSTNNNTTVSRNISGHLGIRANKELEPGGTYEWTIRLECIPPTPSHWICIGVAGVDAMDCHSMFGVSSANCVYPGGVRVPGISGDWRTGDLIHVVYKNATVTIENKRTSKGYTVRVNVSNKMYPFFDVHTQDFTITFVDFK